MVDATGESSRDEHADPVVRRPWIAPSFVIAVTTLLSAFLLFQVQPVISKSILPSFGGSPSVWTTCMLFFQSVLFAGYAYAHLSERLTNGTIRVGLHVALIGAAMLFLPIRLHGEVGPLAEQNPAWRILVLLAGSIGLPYFVLSSTGPLVQAWFSRMYPGRSPYRLYSLSNAGSEAALIGYPFLVEPIFALNTQRAIWSWGFVLFALCCGYAVVQSGKRGASDRAEVHSSPPAVPLHWTAPLLWIALPAFASLMLLATTNHVCDDVAAIPLLWVIPLGLYLLSFIICFDHERWYSRRVWCGFTVVLALAVGVLLDLPSRVFGIQISLPIELTFMQEVSLYFALLFGVCMVCHGELVRLRPDPSRLTVFYLMISAGGAVGGLFVSLIAPVIFRTYFEWKIGVVGGYSLAAFLLVLDLRQRTKLTVPSHLPLTASIAVVGLIVMVICENNYRKAVVRLRDFYGVSTIIERSPENPAEADLALWHGSVIHGVQFTAPEKRRWGTTYYSEESGVGQALAYFHDQPALRVGLIGLGVGTLATYAEPRQVFRFYEINPNMVHTAQTYFTFLKDCRGTVEIVLGDARLSLERESSQGYQVLVLDAFSGSAIPQHLLTEEAFALYERHLTPDGVICVHITNSYLDLSPVVRGVARRMGMEFAHIFTPYDFDRAVISTDWMLLTRNRPLLNFLRDTTSLADAPASLDVHWTDDFSNLLQLVR